MKYLLITISLLVTTLIILGFFPKILQLLVKKEKPTITLVEWGFFAGIGLILGLISSLLSRNYFLIIFALIPALIALLFLKL